MKKKFTAMSLVMAIVMSVFAFQFGGVEAEAAGKTGVGLAVYNRLIRAAAFEVIEL